MPDIERRRIQRINLDQPVSGRLSGMKVTILDVSTIGARVDHTFPLARGRRLRLDFLWEDETISIHCDVTRCISPTGSGVVKPQGYTSGLQFVEPLGPARAALLRMILAMVTRDLTRAKSKTQTEH
ncbi:MAG TPA: PilZ domain-containing protein [Thermoanaerobaculia bacterium]|nr:PilZ domain-containing protein [Thermoanaerobaculia bacterium]